MKRHTDATSQSPRTTCYPCEQPQASGDSTISNPRTRPETEYSGLSSGSSSFNNPGPGAQFNSPQGAQNTTFGSGNQFPGANLGAVTINQKFGKNERSHR